MNSYDPPAEKRPAAEKHTERVTGRPRWIRRFLLLNAFLLSLPVSIVAFVFVSIWVETFQLGEEIGGDVIVTRTEFTGVSGPLWPLLTLLLAPNLVLLWGFLRSRKTESSNKA